MNLSCALLLDSIPGTWRRIGVLMASITALITVDKTTAGGFYRNRAGRLVG